jgi:hypothetical protein
VIKLPAFNRVVLAAGEDAQTGSRKLEALREAMTRGDEPPPTEADWIAFDARAAGKLFARKRGQHGQGRQARVLRPWLLELKARLKTDPDEKALKREQRGLGRRYVLNDRTAEVAHELLLEGWQTGELQRKGWTEVPSADYLSNLLGKMRTK